MKYLLPLVLFAVCLSGSVHAQRDLQLSPTTNTAKTAVASEIRAQAPKLGSFNKSVVADTLFPTIFTEACADSLFNFIPDAPATGFVGGTNSFFDLRKLQRVTLPEATNLTISEALIAFSIADQNISDRRISVEIFGELDADGNLGAVLGTSDSITVGDISVSSTGISFTSFTFSEPVTITDANSFLISVNLSDLYFNAQDSVDYIGNAVIWSTDNGCGDGENALEIFPAQGGGLGFGTILADWGINVEFLMGAVIERDPFTSNRNPVADYATTVAPNPASDVLNLAFTSPGNDQMSASLLSVDGRILRNQAMASVNGTQNVQWNVSDLPAGVYLYQISGPAGIETGRVVIQ